MKNSLFKKLKELFKPLKDVVHDQVYISKVPSYGNSFFFTIGVYLLELFVILAITGIIMVIFGPYWWNLNPVGTFIRSIHLWAAEAFITLMFVHLFVNFSTSAFKKKRLIWMVGSAMLLLVLLQFAFGVGFGGGLVSQWNAKAGADLWNGMGLGFWINPLNQGAVFGWHVAIIPMILVLLMALHFFMVKRQGISKPYRKDIPYKMVAADHSSMYRRMLYIFIIVLAFSILFSSPYIPPLTISQAATTKPQATATTFLNEFNFSSDTATYLDTINPYTFSTRNVYVLTPYYTYLNLTDSTNEAALFFAENASARDNTLVQAYSYFGNNGSISGGLNSTNPMISMASQLTAMAQKGVYQPILQSEESSGLDNTYVIRFLFDTGVLNSTSYDYGLDPSEWGMLEVGAPPWALQYWLAPYDYMEIATSNIPWWNDIENGTVTFLMFLTLMFLPFIPGLRKLPDKLKLHKLFWNRFTNPEQRKKHK